MLSFFDSYRDLTMAAIILRMVLPCICGGLIGLEREFKRRPAGFRTHILICLGAASTTLTSQYLAISMNQFTDIARLGAQVVAGIGFIGAGTIIVTRRQTVKGLTTAAGLWTSAIVGLSIGAGFYEGGILATILVLLAETLFFRLEHWIIKHAPEVNFFMEYTEKECMDRVLQLYQEKKIKVLNLEITRAAGSTHHNACAMFCLRMHKRCSVDALLTALNEIEGIISVEEL